MEALEKSCKEQAAAESMLKKADAVLAEIDTSYIISQRGHSYRKMPVFRPEEITLGGILGKGGFGVVNVVSKFTLDDAGEFLSKDKPDSTESIEISMAAESTQVHYDVTKARSVMSRRCERNGDYRYALKRLHDDLGHVEQARGMVDMAVEAKFLSVVWHPNIIKMRGMATGDLVNKDFFIILDRLHETLDKRINEWYKTDKENTKFSLSPCGRKRKQEAVKELMIERLTVAYDLAAAFMYLHENR
jgi:hypothetical protein